MAKKAWAYFQGWVARRVGGRVIPRTHYGDSVPDVVTDRFLLECKRMKRIPVSVVKAVDQAKGYCKGNYADLTPVAVFGEPRYTRVIVAMDFRDFLALIGSPGCTETSDQVVSGDRAYEFYHVALKRQERENPPG